MQSALFGCFRDEENFPYIQSKILLCKFMLTHFSSCYTLLWAAWLCLLVDILVGAENPAEVSKNFPFFMTNKMRSLIVSLQDNSADSFRHATWWLLKSCLSTAVRCVLYLKARDNKVPLAFLWSYDMFIAHSPPTGYFLLLLVLFICFGRF